MNHIDKIAVVEEQDRIHRPQPKCTIAIAIVEANLSKVSSRDRTVQSMIGTVLSPEQHALMVGSRDAMMLLALKQSQGCIVGPF